MPPVERLGCEADIEGVPGVEGGGYGGQVARPTRSEPVEGRLFAAARAHPR